MNAEILGGGNMKSFKYVVYQEGKYYVSQCLNVDVSSFGETAQEAIDNLKEAVELYLENENVDQFYQPVGEMFTGEAQLNA
jgi:predicted RNase H-like HicB family nuclease